MGLSLPVIPAPTPSPEAAGSPHMEIDRTRPYLSCEWLEQGLAFNRRSLNACLIVHHGRGFPFLIDYNGGPIDFAAVQRARTAIVAENQAGGHEACRGCPHLKLQRWPKPRYPVRLLGIAHFSHCNIQCNYCFLQTADPAVFRDGFTPYAIMPALRQLVSSGWLAPNCTSDWGGGEPTIYREFDAVLQFLTRRGGKTWVHTNGTRLPRVLQQGLSTRRIHILCSVDAGTPAVWRLIKGRDLLESVWKNLADMIVLGCNVVLKYIMKEENCEPEELAEFLRRAAACGALNLIIDIDYDAPRPSKRVLAGLRLLRDLAGRRGLYVTFGATGALYTPEIDIQAQLDFEGKAAIRTAWAAHIYHKTAMAKSAWSLFTRRMRANRILSS